MLDPAVHRAGLTAVRQLAGRGADAIEIEPPGEAKGDVPSGVRHRVEFQNPQRDKRGMTLNLKTPEAHAIFMRFGSTADAMVKNYRSDVKCRLNMDCDTIAALTSASFMGASRVSGRAGRTRRSPA